MSFEARIVAFADRFLSERTFRLVVEPALADLQFDDDTGRRSRLANRLAVLRAVAGAVRTDAGRDTGTLLKLLLMSACYFTFPITLGLDNFRTWSDFFLVCSMMMGLSVVPVLVCFWPERHTPRPD